MNNDDPTAHPLAYKSEDFLDSDDARPLRILAEYLQPMQAFRRQHMSDTIVFFGSARIAPGGSMARYYDEAQELARLVTAWSMSLPSDSRRYVICTGGGPGIMEAGNRGAADAGGRSIGLKIGLPNEQQPNRYASGELLFEFNYFFMRKLWFASLARALVVFPGGLGTLDELFEILTLAQTQKLNRRIYTVLYGSQFWREVIDFQVMIRHNLIDPSDLDLFQFADDPQSALALLQQGLAVVPEETPPAFAHSRRPP